MSHSNIASELAAGMKALPGVGQSFSQTQALWRFLANDSVTFEALSQPLMDMAHSAIQSHCGQYILAAHDWSHINYGGHSSKEDRLQMSHKMDIGYELQSTLLISDRDGSPLVSPVQNLVTADGVLSSRNKKVLPSESHLDELTDRIEWLEGQSFAKKLVHIVDREADSVQHLRRWSASGASWLVRVKEGSTVNYDGFDVRLSDVANDLTYREIGIVICKGKQAQQSVASTKVVLTRKAKSKKMSKEEEATPLSVKLVVSRIHNGDGQLIAQWFLLADVEQSIDEATLANWYYYRWNIESYFKLLKQAGHQLERWEQETGSAVFKRLLIVAQACALVWRIMRLESEKAKKMKAFLVRLSGRQMKRKQPVTASALLDGLFKLYMMIEVLEQYTLDELKDFAKIVQT